VALGAAARVRYEPTFRRVKRFQSWEKSVSRHLPPNLEQSPRILDV